MTTPLPSPCQRAANSTEVAIVGGGLSGTLAAIVLARGGFDVALVDPDTTRQTEFRVEKIGGDQIGMLERLGLLDIVTATAVPYDHVVNYRRGKVIDETRAPYYGIRYRDFVSTLRARLPQQVRRIVARADDIATSKLRQTVSLSDGTQLEARLVVLATGMGDILRRRLGIERRVLHAHHSLSFGFDMRPIGRDAFRHRALTFYGERFGDGIDYLTMFPVGNGMRANLFTYLPHTDPWVKALRSEPVATIARSMPAVGAVIGDYEIVGGVQTWLMDIAVADNVRQDGVVVIGDAFQTSCPAAGTGVSRLLTDVEQLCLVHLPLWLASPGMGAAKIATYYDDPRKQAMDTRAIALADYRRNITIDPSLGWAARRQALVVRRRTMATLESAMPDLARRLRALRHRSA